MRKKIIVMSLVLFAIHSMAQIPKMNNFDINEHLPEQNSLIRHINNPVDYSRGLTDISIPLYEIKSSGLTLPISLSYYHGGIKVNEYSKWIGQGWTLSAEPSIVRNIRGKEDKLNDIKSEDIGSFPTPNELYQHCYSLSTGVIDEEPDLFYYKLLDRSGSFILRKKTSGSAITAVTIPYDPIKIILINNNQAIQITDDNGNVYTFDIVEGSTNSLNVGYEIPDIINSWKCSTIKNESGKTLFKFKYVNGSPDRNPIIAVGNIFEDNPQYKITTRTNIPNYLPYNRQMSTMIWTPIQGTYPGSYTGDYYVSFGGSGEERHCERLVTLYPKRLRNIEFDNDSIVFNTLADASLGTISGLGKTITFTNHFTDDISSNNIDDKCPVLESISIGADSKTQNYAIEYNGDIPSKPRVEDLLSDIDYWGNLTTSGNDFNWTLKLNHKKSPLMPPTQSDDKIYEFGLGSLKEGKPSQQGILKSITDPLGCKTEFTFEPNAYIKEVRVDPGDNSGISADFTDTRIVYSGGLRIRQIDYTDQNGSKLNRVFKYGEEKENAYPPFVNGDDAETGLGVIKRQVNVYSFMDNQKRFLYYSTNEYDANSITRLRTIYFSPKGQTTFSGAPVIYPRVTEYQTAVDNNGTVLDNGKIVYAYNFPSCSWDTYDDISTADNKYFVDKEDNWKWGQLVSKKTYKRNQQNKYDILSMTEYEYTDNIAPADSYKLSKVFQEYIFDINGNSQPNIVNLTSSGSTFNPLNYFSINIGDIYAYKRYTISTGIKKISTETNSTYTDNGVVISKKEYIYGNSNHVYPTKIKVTNSDNIEHIQEFRYPLDTPSDYLAQNTEHIQAKTQLITDWNISPVIETTSTTGTSIENTYNFYKKFTNCQAPLVSKIVTERNSTSKEEQVICDKYDSYGNPISILKRGTDQAIYLWSYNGKYPIAKILNATYDQVKSALNYTDSQIESLASNPNPDVQAISNLLRSYTYNKIVSITTYSYKPSVGMSSSTDPRGIITYYNYDNFGRLINIKDSNGKLVKSFDYNYKQ